MWFGLCDVDEAEGTILAHRLLGAQGAIKKGTMLTKADVQALQAAGHCQIMVARLEIDDVAENEAATQIAASLIGQGLYIAPAFTGRVNVFASQSGLFLPDKAMVDALNRLDESITLATLAEFSPVAVGDMVATVKIIPYAAPRSKVEAACDLGALCEVKPFIVKKVALIAARAESVPAKVLAKTKAVTEARLKALGAELTLYHEADHKVAALATAIVEVEKTVDLIILFGASAIADRGDLLPQAIVQAGGEIIHFGMPVDPGNLLLLASLNAKPVVGAPGCARSPKHNGFDGVLARLCAGLTVTKHDIQGMGVGGLLKEIGTRPQPRQGEKPLIFKALVLAAGRSARMQGPNKLLMPFGNEPLLHRVVRQICAVDAFTSVSVVTGHMALEVEAALHGLNVGFIHNPHFAEGLSTSLRAGLEQIGEADAVLVALGDMPLVDAALIQSLLAAFNPAQQRSIIVPVVEGRRGNPIVWGSDFFAALKAVNGDKGGRDLLAQYAHHVFEVEVSGDGALIDLDTPQAFREHGAS